MRWLIVVVMICVSSMVFAQEAALQFDQANQLYRNGNYKQAAEIYEQIAKAGYENPMLFYNLGNCYFKLREIPSAILNYERAKRLAPHDEDIAYNLLLANLRITDKIEPLPRLFIDDWWRAAVTSFSSDSWGLIGIISLWSAALGGALVIIVTSYAVQRTAFVISLIAILLTAFSFVAVSQQLHREQNELHGIVFSPTVSIKSAPDEQSTDLFVLHEGVNVELLDSLGEWKKIRLADGKIGWLQSTNVELI